MIYPTIDQLANNQYNRYQLALATAKCARMITDEYVRQRTAAENALTATKEGGGMLLNMIDPKLANNKAVKNAIDGISNGDYVIVDSPEEPEQETEWNEQGD